MEIKIQKTTHPKEKPAKGAKLGFGSVFTDHMLLMDYLRDRNPEGAKTDMYLHIINTMRAFQIPLA